MESSRDVTALPFNRLVGLQKPQPGQPGLVTLEPHAGHENHLGTVHASAQFSLAEASSGDYLVQHFPQLTTGYRAVPRHVDAKFRRPAQGTLQTTATAAEELVAKFLADLGAKGRAFLEVQVSVSDASGAVTLTGSFEWYVQRVAEV